MTVTLRCCPLCGDRLHPMLDGRRRVQACLCGFVEGEGRPVALKLPGLDRGRQEVLLREKEAQIVEAVRSSLQSAGYRVLRVGQRRPDLAGNDRGCPDLFTTLCGMNLWRGLEVKVPGGPYSGPEQEALAEAGEVCVVTSALEALRAVQDLAEASRRSVAGFGRDPVRILSEEPRHGG